MKNLRIFLVMAAAALFAAPQPSHAGEEAIVVIANKAVSAATISRDDLRPIFQSKKTTWPDGSPLRAFNLPDANPTRHGFDAAVLGLDPDRVARYWIDQKIRGGQRPPASAPTPALVLRVVAATAGGIGYVPASAANATVKVIAKISNGQVTRP